MYLREIREAKAVSVKQLAADAGFSKVQIWNWESGRREPSLADLVTLADYFGVSIDYLIRGEKKEPPTEARERLADATFDALANLSPEAREIALAVLNALQQAQTREGQSMRERE